MSFPNDPAPERKHVLFVPYPALGHIIPTLEFAKMVAEHHHVTFIIAERKLAEVLETSILPATLHDQLRVITFNDGVSVNPHSIPGLKRLAESVQQMKPNLTLFLNSLFLNSFSNFEVKSNSIPKEINPEILTSSATGPVDVVVSDRYLSSIVLPLCHGYKIPGCIFNCPAIVDGLDINENTPTVTDEELVNVESVQNFGVLDQPVTDWLKDFIISMNDQLHLASAILLNTFRELDEDSVKILSTHPKAKNIPVYCVGPLVPSEKGQPTDTESEHASVERRVREWMDKQEKQSVVYVSFGSLAYLTEEQTRELAKALMEPGMPFILSIREKFHKFLPEELQQGIDGREREDSKFVVLSWAPQKTILNHDAYGVFVTHAGWNSTLEGIAGGVPMVAWPMFADQYINAQWMSDKGLAVLIAKTKLTGGRTVPAEEIAQAIQRLKSGKFRNQVGALQAKAKMALAEGGSSSLDRLKFMQLDFPSTE